MEVSVDPAQGGNKNWWGGAAPRLWRWRRVRLLDPLADRLKAGHGTKRWFMGSAHLGSSDVSCGMGGVWGAETRRKDELCESPTPGAVLRDGFSARSGTRETRPPNDGLLGAAPLAALLRPRTAALRGHSVRGGANAGLLRACAGGAGAETRPVRVQRELSCWSVSVW
jgi:hypothetical protein